MSALVAHHLAQGYGSRRVFSDLSLALNPGVTALLGPNGAGKTTLLATLATAMPPKAGTLRIAGSAVTSEREARRARRTIGYLPQSFGYDPRIRVRDFVNYAAWLRGVPKNTARSAVSDALHHVGLDQKARNRLGSLSGGMRQRAGIAWAIVGNPALVLLDEPTVGLDPEQRLNFRETLRGLDASTVLLSTHLTDDVDAVCEQTVVMSHGRVIFAGPTGALRDIDDGSSPGHTPLERAYMGLLKSTGAPSCAD